MKKTMSVLLALVLLLALSVPAMAAGEGTITINNAVVGQTYTIYRILELESYNLTTNAYSYKATTDWEDFINSADIKDIYVSVNDEGYVTWKDGADAAAFAKLARAYAANASNNVTAQGTANADSTNVTFNNLELGYYLVDSTLGTLCSLDTTNPTVNIEEKNAEPSNVKTVEEDSTPGVYGQTNDADIGQTVNFKSTITAQAGAENYVFHDAMSIGLTYTGVTGVTLKRGVAEATTVDSANYEIKTEGLTDGCTFEIVFTQAFCDTLKANDKIEISYTATVNENAVVGGNGNPNESHLSYGDQNHPTSTPDSTTMTYTWEIDVLKYTTKDGKEVKLADAVFTLSRDEKGTDLIKLVKVEDNVYRVAKTGETGITQITTDATGAFTIKGLDSDTYYLTEIAQPAGYNKLAAPIKVVIDDHGTVNYNNNYTGTVRVENKTGAELPSTGGVGTTVFYVVGGLMVLLAVVLLVTRKKMSAGKD